MFYKNNCMNKDYLSSLTVKSLSGLSDEEINELESKILKSRKYKLCLSYVNGILSKLGKPLISDLCDFSSITRDELLNSSSVYNDYSERVYSLFNKTSCGYYRRGSENDIINCLRGMCRELGLVLNGKSGSVGYGNSIFKSTYRYFIENK